MKTKFLISALFALGLTSACSREGAPKSLSQLNDAMGDDDFGMGGDDFEMGNTDEDEFGMGGGSGESQDTCNVLGEGLDSLVGEYRRIGIPNQTAQAFPEVPFAFVADSVYSVPAFARAIQAVFTDPISANDPSQTQSLYLTPNVRNIIKISNSQVFLFGTEKRWLEVTTDVLSNNIIIKEYAKGSSVPVGERSLTANREYLATSLTGLQNLNQLVYIERQLFVIERLGTDTFSFEFKFKGAGQRSECYALTGNFAGSELETIYGFGKDQAEAKNNLRSVCLENNAVPGFENMSCDFATVYCSDRPNVESITDEVVPKLTISQSCLDSGLGDSGKYLVAAHQDQQSPTSFPNVISKIPTNYDAFFVATAAATDAITVSQIGEIAKKEFKTYRTDSEYREFDLNAGDTVYIGYQSSIGKDVPSYAEFKKVGSNYVVKHFSFGGLVSTTVVAPGTDKNGEILLYGNAAAINFVYYFGEREPYNGSKKFIGITANKLQF